MARVEKQADVKKQLEQVKGEVVKQVKQSTRTRRPWLACGVLTLLALGGIVLWGLWMIAATGLVHIPLLSALAYSTPEPQRMIESGMPVEPLLQEWIATAALEQARTGTSSESTLTLTEQMLTSSARQSLSESEWSMFDAEGAHLIIEPNSVVQVFLPIAGNKQQTALQMESLVEAREGQLSVQIQTIQIGSYQLPAVIEQNFITPTLRRELESLNTELRRYLQLTSLSTSEAELTVTGSLAAEVESPL